MKFSFYQCGLCKQSATRLQTQCIAAAGPALVVLDADVGVVVVTME